MSSQDHNSCRLPTAADEPFAKYQEKSCMTIPWQKLTPESVPEKHHPVILRLKDKKTLKQKQDESSLLSHSLDYGFVVAVTEWGLDGFGRSHPVDFRELNFGTNGAHNIGNRVRFEDVVEWAYLA